MTWFVLACAGTHDPGAAMATANEPLDITGTWVSAPCGQRTWTRTLVIEAGGAYHGVDPVSPCPPGATCIWSGIIEFRGTWAVSAAEVTLTEEAERRPPMAAAYQRPATLTVRDGSLFDGEGCAYERAKQ